MISVQTLLSEYLQYDLYHSIGAYSVARDRLGELADKMEHTSTPRTGEAAEHEAIARDRETQEKSKLLTVTRLARQYNDQLVRKRHLAHPATEDGPTPGLGRPIPDGFPLTLERRFQIGDSPHIEDARRNPWARPRAWGWISNYYEAAIAAIDVVEDDERRERLKADNEQAEKLVTQFAQSMVWPRDRPAQAADPDEETQIRRRQLRKARFRARLDRALEQLPGIPRETPRRSDDATEFIPRIATDNLSSGYESVPLFVIQAAEEAHLTHHAVEAWQSMSLGAHALHAAPHLVPPRPHHGSDHSWDPSHWLHKELDRCIVLDTFVHSASRCAPWMFAANDAECKEVFDEFPDALRNGVPTRCMWISAQVSLLALHRRAYSYALKGERTFAYNDYYKLQRHIRNARRRLDDAPLHIAGAHDFLTCLEARANQNIGELYRAEHAQQPALKYFQTALECLQKVDRTGEMDAVLTNSRWQVELQLSRGKASYEMGRHKEALRWHLEGWRTFLALMAADTKTQASTEKIGEAIAWLDEIKFEPDLRKRELQEHLRPVVDQLERIQVAERFGGLAAEILLRLGHVLLVLRLGLADPPTKADRRESAKRRERFAETLAFQCLRKATQCDSHGTLIAADLLKARLRLAGWVRGKKRTSKPALEGELELPEIAAVPDQWARGGDDYERLARVAEYVTLLSLDPDTAPSFEHEPRDRRDEILLSRGLLLNFFMHTDSINVRKAQTHRYLMQGRAPAHPPRDVPRFTHASKDEKDPAATASGSGTAGANRPPADEPAGARPGPACRPDDPDGTIGPAIELICMRRYSSAFPLLPRPSAFRAHGGGYLVRLHPSWRQPDPEGAEPTDNAEPRSAGPPDPIGVVIDPGPDFIENLYRTGFSLSDIDMIVVTHDHVDHLNSLESLLSLLNYRNDLLKHQATAPATERPPSGESAPGEPLENATRSPSDGPEEKILFVYGNESILERYREVAMLNPVDTPRFKPLREMGDDPNLRPAEFDGFSVTSMSSQTVDGTGHLDLSRKPSHGVCFRHHDAQLSLAITSDTPAPPHDDEPQYAQWTDKWEYALKADVLVAHMSTVPLTELRQITKLDARLSMPRRAVNELDRQIEALDGELDQTLTRIRDDLYQQELAIQRIERQAEDEGVSLETLPAYALARKQRKTVQASDRRLHKLKKKLARLREALGVLTAPKSGGGRPRPTPPRVIDAMNDIRNAGATLLTASGALRKTLEDIDHRPVLRDELARLALDAEALGQEAENPTCDAESLEEIRTRLQSENPDLRGRVEFSMWLRSRDPGPTADLVGLVDSDPDDPDAHWRPPRDHPYLKGTLAWARAYRHAREQAQPRNANGLFVLGELSEELGTARGKIAGQINDTLFRKKKQEKPRPFSALTSDVGLRIFVVPAAPQERRVAERREDPRGSRPADQEAAGREAPPKRGSARILCTTCELDTDRISDERYHSADCIREVCVKGENEGIFYNCTHHDPGAEHVFLEQLERFDVFGR
jgi:tetratricopeptide (TPR) repeat protein